MKNYSGTKKATLYPVTVDDEGMYNCICGNEPASYGFFRCDDEGNYLEIDPFVEYNGRWLWVCDQCGRIIEDNPYEERRRLAVVGYRKTNTLTEKERRTIEQAQKE